MGALNDIDMTTGTRKPLTTYGSKRKKHFGAAASHGSFSLSPETHKTRFGISSDEEDNTEDLHIKKLKAMPPLENVFQEPLKQPVGLELSSFFAIKSKKSKIISGPSEENDETFGINSSNGVSSNTLGTFKRRRRKAVKTPTTETHGNKLSLKDDSETANNKRQQSGSPDKVEDTNSKLPETIKAEPKSPAQTVEKDSSLEAYGKVERSELGDLFSEPLPGQSKLASPAIIHEDKTALKTSRTPAKKHLSVSFSEDYKSPPDPSSNRKLTEEDELLKKRLNFVKQESEAWNLLGDAFGGSIVSSQVMKVSSTINASLEQYSDTLSDESNLSDDNANSDLTFDDMGEQTNLKFTSSLTKSLADHYSESISAKNSSDNITTDPKEPENRSLGSSTPALRSGSRTYGIQRSFLADSNENATGHESDRALYNNSDDEILLKLTGENLEIGVESHIDNSSMLDGTEHDSKADKPLPQINSFSNSTINTKSQSTTPTMPGKLTRMPDLKKRIRGINDLRGSATDSRVSDELQFLIEEVINAEDIHMKRSSLLDFSLKILRGNKGNDSLAQGNLLLHICVTNSFPTAFYHSVAKEDDPIITFCFGFIMNEILSHIIIVSHKMATVPDFKPIVSLLQSNTNMYLFKRIIANMTKNSFESVLTQSSKTKHKLSKLSAMTLSELLNEIMHKRLIANSGSTSYSQIGNRASDFKDGKNNHKFTSVDRGKMKSNEEFISHGNDLNSHFYAINILISVNYFSDIQLLAEPNLQMNASILNYDATIFSNLIDSTIHFHGSDLNRSFLVPLIVNGAKNPQNFSIYTHRILQDFSSFKIANYFLILKQWLACLNFDNSKTANILEVFYGPNSDLSLKDITENSHLLTVTQSSTTDALNQALGSKSSTLSFAKVLEGFSSFPKFTRELLNSEDFAALLSDDAASSKEIENALLLLNCYSLVLRVLIVLTSNTDKLFQLILSSLIQEKKALAEQTVKQYHHALFNPENVTHIISTFSLILSMADQINIEKKESERKTLQVSLSSLSLFMLGYLVNLIEDPYCLKAFLTPGCLSKLQTLLRDSISEQPAGSGSDTGLHSSGYLSLAIGLLYIADPETVKSYFSNDDISRLIETLQRFVSVMPDIGDNTEDNTSPDSSENPTSSGIKHQVNLVMQKLQANPS